MMAAVVISRPPVLRAALAKVRRAMDVVLHIGSHRTASTSFQAYLRDNDAVLSRQGIGVWDPKRTRGGLFAGVWPEAEMMQRRGAATRAAGRIALALRAEQALGRHSLVISDENVIGPPRDGLRARALYPAAGERVARLAAAFQGRISQAVLSIRCPDAYWTSLIAMTVARGRPLPGPHRLQALADSPRSWRDVITDVACALPDVPLLVMPHEAFGAVPERRLAMMLPSPFEAPRLHARRRLNAAPKVAQMRDAMAMAGRDISQLPQGDGAYRPFDAAQSAALQESYADDLFWLHAGADGLATIIIGKSPGSEGKTPAPDQTERGHDDGQQGRVAQAG